MHPDAIKHAQNRLAKAEQASEALYAAQAFDETEAAWEEFLLAFSSVYSKLEQGAKSSGPSMGWFGRVKKLRKDDQLLQYLHHARNSVEHSIQEVTKRKVVEWRWPLRSRSKLGKEIGLQLDPGSTLVSVRGADEYGRPLFIGEPRIRYICEVVAVTDARYGDIFDPPAKHLGSPVPDDVAEIAGLSLAYLRHLIQEAQALPPAS